MKPVRKSQSAFTLIEMLVIAPMIILLIGTVITLVATLTGSALQAAKKNELIHQAQAALSTIESNAQYSLGSIQLNVSTGFVAPPQGRNDTSAAFVSNTTDTLVMKLPATDKSTFSYGRSIIYAQPNCSTSTTPYPVYYVYFLKNRTLYERTILGSSIASSYCGSTPPYQRGSCAAGQIGSSCQKQDEILATNVEAFNISYDNNIARVTLKLEESIAGEKVSYTSTRYATHDDSLEGAPSAPAVTSVYNNNYTNTYSWEPSDNTTGYNVTYCIGTNPCQNGPQNTLNRTFNLTVPRRQNVEVRVEAIASTGNFNYIPATSAAPSWQECTPQGSWVNYDATYNTLGYTLTSSGAVGLKGLVRSGSLGTVLCTLPVGLRPSHRLIFNGVGHDPNGLGGNGSARIDVFTDGRIIIQGGSNNTYINGFVSLDGIIFMAGNPGWTSSGAAWANGWYYNGVGYGDTTYPNIAYYKDSQSRAWVQGLATGGPKSGSMATLPSTLSPISGSSHYPVSSDNRLGAINVNTSASIVARNSSGGYVSNQLLYQASGTTGMVGLPLYNGWSQYGGWATASCKRGTDDIVILQGLITGGSSSGTVPMTHVGACGTMSTDRRALFSIPRDTDAQGRIDLPATNQSPGGDYMYPMATSTTWTSLDGIHYIAD